MSCDLAVNYNRVHLLLGEFEREVPEWFTGSRLVSTVTVTQLKKQHYPH